MCCFLWLRGPWLWRRSRVVHRYRRVLKEGRLSGNSRRLGRHNDRRGQVHRCRRSIWPGLRLRFLLLHGDPNMWYRSYMLPKENRETSSAYLRCTRAVELVHYDTRRGDHPFLSLRPCLLWRLPGGIWIDWGLHGDSRNYACSPPLPLGDFVWIRGLRCTRHSIPNDLLNNTNSFSNNKLFWLSKLKF